MTPDLRQVSWRRAVGTGYSLAYPQLNHPSGIGNGASVHDILTKSRQEVFGDSVTDEDYAEMQRRARRYAEQFDPSKYPPQG